MGKNVLIAMTLCYPLFSLPAVVTPFKPPPDVMGAAKVLLHHRPRNVVNELMFIHLLQGKEKEHDEKEPRVGDTWKPVKVDVSHSFAQTETFLPYLQCNLSNMAHDTMQEAKQNYARSLDTVFDLKELAESTGQQSSKPAPVPARPFQPVKAPATGGSSAAPISLGIYRLLFVNTTLASYFGMAHVVEYQADALTHFHVQTRLTRLQRSNENLDFILRLPSSKLNQP